MKATKAARTMIESSGLSHRQITARMGKSPTYLSPMLATKNGPRADTLAEIASACGWTLALEGPTGERIEIG